MQKVTKGKTALHTGKRSRKRGDKKRQGRKGIISSNPKGASVIAHSLFALTLTKKTATEVFLKLEDKLPEELEGINSLKMYNDLLVSYRKAMKLLGKEYLKTDLYQAGLPLHVALGSLGALFEKDCVPKGYIYNVDYNSNSEEYYFTIFRGCEFPWQWHAFEIKPIVYELRRSPRLLDLFFKFIRCFQSRLNIPFWFQGSIRYNTMEWVVDQEIENLLEIESELDPDTDDMESHEEEFIELMACIDCYFQGEARYYEEIIRATPYYSPKRLLAALKNYKGFSPEVEFMKEALSFIDGAPGWDAFVYENHYYEYGEGVTLDDQVGIIWDADDVIMGHHCQFLDDESANVGVMEPIVSLPIRPYTNELSFKSLKDMEKFPLELSRLFNRYVRLINHLKEQHAKSKN